MEYYLGVSHTTFCMHVVKITEIQAILNWRRKQIMLPSIFCGPKKSP